MIKYFFLIFFLSFYLSGSDPNKIEKWRETVEEIGFEPEYFSEHIEYLKTREFLFLRLFNDINFLNDGGKYQSFFECDSSMLNCFLLYHYNYCRCAGVYPNVNKSIPHDSHQEISNFFVFQAYKNNEFYVYKSYDRVEFISQIDDLVTYFKKKYENLLIHDEKIVFTDYEFCTKLYLEMNGLLNDFNESKKK